MKVYKKSVIFSSLESVLKKLEEEITTCRNLQESYLTKLHELPEDCDEWYRDDTQSRIDREEIEQDLYEDAYNYIYMNFQKLMSKYSK